MASRKKLLTKLTKEELKTQFISKFLYSREILLCSLANYTKEFKIDNVILVEFLSFNNIEELSQKIYDNVVKYLIKYQIVLTQFDALKIIQELKCVLINKLDTISDDTLFDYLETQDSKEIEEFKKELKKVLYLSILDSFITILKEKTGRELHQNNIKKIVTIIMNGAYEEIYSDRTLYYIFRNAMDLDCSKDNR